MDEPVSWKYYIATGITAVIACFLSAVQGDAGVFSRVREILIVIFRSEVHPLWVFVPAFLMGMCACWVERPKNSRSVLIAGLASFSLFGFAPYAKGLAEGRLERITPPRLLIQAKEAYPGLPIIIRDQDFQIIQRGTLTAEAGFVLDRAGPYTVEINGDTRYRSVLYAIDWQNAETELAVELKPLSAWEGFLQSFVPAARAGRVSK